MCWLKNKFTRVFILLLTNNNIENKFAFMDYKGKITKPYFIFFKTLRDLIVQNSLFDFLLNVGLSGERGLIYQLLNDFIHI